MLKFLDLLFKVMAVWGAVKGLQPGQSGELPLIKTKVDGKKWELGPTPVKRTG